MLHPQAAMEEELDFQMIEFWGQELPGGGKQYSVEVENEPPVFQVVHITGCALGENPKPGPHVLKVLSPEGKAIVVATLERGAATQAPLDFGISSTTVFINAGPSPVHISGYVTRSVEPFEGSDEEDEDEEDSEEEDEDEDEEDLEDSDADEAPRLVAMNGTAAAKRKARGSPFVDDEADETDDDGSGSGSGSEDEEEDEESGSGTESGSGSEEEDDDDEDEDMDGGGEDGLPELDSDDMIAEADEDEDDSDGEGARLDWAELEPAVIVIDGQTVLDVCCTEPCIPPDTIQHTQCPPTLTDDDDDGSDSDSDAPPAEKPSNKRPAAPAATPQPPKKAKQAPAAAAPASAPPKVGGKQQQQQAGGGGGGDAAYLDAIVSFLQQEGKPVPLAALGSKVPRPAGVKAKAKAFVQAHADRLAFDEKAQTVALKGKK